MKEEMKSLIFNQTWELTKLASGKKELHNKWVYWLKEDNDGFKWYKYQLVVKGFKRRKWLYWKFCSGCDKHNTIRFVLSTVANDNLYLDQFDVRTAFLHGYLVEKIYMQKPEGFSEEWKENMVCRLKKILYGMKQPPRQCYMKFESFIGKEWFKKYNFDHYCFFKRYKSYYIMLLLYVDDVLIAGLGMDKIRNLKM